VIRIVVADDQALVRRGFASILDSIDGFSVVGEAENGADAVALAVRERPDVILMDVRMPHMDGLEATRRITADPDLAATRILILTTFDLDEYVHEALCAGASGFLLKDTMPAELIHAVEVIANGEALIAPKITRRLIEEFARVARPATIDAARLGHLTHRERVVLAEVAHGLSNAEIAEALYVSQATVKTHIGRLLMKLDARDRAQLVMTAYETGLVQPSRPS
jgi:DNA-binding NarL/FixJ family response regulator